ncbi:MAG: NifU N-terminal domain-containing protein, partial [Alphaproteobacteria bacterium]|nr:NifU N-terminal domain-containing protein [Alphaproteobacteria bacterium]
MFIQTETTPNPDAIKFIPGQAVTQGNTYDYRTAD